MRNLRTVYTAGLAAALIVIMVVPGLAQAPVAARSTSAAVMSPVERVDLLVGRSTILRTSRPIKRVSLPKPEIADAMVTSPNEVLVHGKTPGTISLLVWGDNGDVSTYDVQVRRDLSELEQRVKQLFPGEPITVSSNGADVVLSGIVSSKYVVDKATSLASGYVEKADNVVNLMRQQEGMASNQVLLRVRFAEVSRSAMQELGASFFTSPTGVKNTVGRLTTQQFAAPGYDKLEWTKESFDFGAPVTSAKGEFTFSDFLNLFLLSEKYDLGAMVRALSSKGLFQSLAEPNLVTQNGKEASFLAGGEYPYPVVQGTGGNAAVTIVFKEFGVRLKFTPTVIGNELIHLKVAPEVSSLDFGNAVSFEGFRVPALSTRRTETEVELRDGQTFAIAGLIDNSLTSTMSKVPGIGDIPILGYLFRSKAYQKNTTELVVMITPQILRRDSTGVTPRLPDLVEPYLPAERKTVPPPAPAFTDRPSASAAPAAPAAPAPVAPAAIAAPRVTDAAVAPSPAAPAAPAAPAGPIAPAASAAPRASAAPQVPKVSSAAAPATSDADYEKAVAKAQKEHEKRVRAEEKRKAEEAKKRQAELKKQQAQQKKLEEQQRRIDEAQQKKAGEEQKKLAEEQKKLEEQEQREREEQAKLRDEMATQDFSAVSAQTKKLEEQRAAAERKKAEERKKVQQKEAKRRALNAPYPPLRSRRNW